MSTPLRILYYNWVDYLDAEKRGGGVTLYQRNIIEGLQGHAQSDITFLSSGVSYDLPARAPRWEVQRHGAKTDTVQRYELVNSGVLAPAHHSFGDPAQVSHPATRDVFFDFVARTGPYDVIHFNNLEGVPADVLDIKQQYPKTRVIVSLHNYYPVCSQVNLWVQERETCEDFQGGARCVTCLPHQNDARMLRVANGLSYRLRCAGLQPGTWAYDVAFRGVMGVGSRALRLLRKLRGQGKPLKGPVLDSDTARTRAAEFAARRAAMTALINANCDRVLCVSEAVAVLAQRYGIDPALTLTSYIGTVAAQMYGQTERAPDVPANQTLTLGYLGYMRRDKGFFFLLDALEALPAEMAAQVRLVVAARAGDSATMARLARLGMHLAGVTHHDGYTHDEMDKVLNGVDVGVVPVLWHDNLPQVAIEMHARHIPLLTSDRGGACELGGSADMVFAAGDRAAFGARISALLAREVDFDTYWDQAMTPPQMPAHLAQLMDVYTAKSAGV